MRKYEIFTNPIRQADGTFKTMYELGYILDPNKPPHCGNRMVIEGFWDETKAKAALELKNNSHPV